MNTLILREPKALLNKPLQDFLRRAIENTPGIAPNGFDVCAPDIFEFVTSEENFMILGAESGEFKCALMGYFNTSNLFPYPTVVLLYNEGSKALKKEVMERAMEIMLEKGYTKAITMNGTSKPDAVWQRAFEMKGKTTSKIIGSLSLFEVA